ncbi:MAG TPA: PatB family C-S lyase [Bacteroidales bacterium]|nr:PatB family C-S lyase [Bacteroidales bacterium]
MWRNFDDVPPREGTNSIKYDLRKETFGSSDIIPMWVADMDFRTPGFIIDALRKRTGHEIMGYTFRPMSYFSSIITWLETRYGWKTEREWICFSPGIVPALNFATLAFTSPGDGIIMQPPVYHPFFPAVNAHGRNIIFNPLVERNGSWEMDFDSLRECASGKPKMLMLSNPHNPVGRAWDPDELATMAGICLENNIIILSDEIHCDLVLPGYRHTPVASLAPEIARITATCIAPSKTFNLAGLSTSSVIIPDNELRKKFTGVTENLHITGGNIFGTEASIAAYSLGHEWLESLLIYLDANAAFLKEYFTARIPSVIPAPLEATYLQWLDCRRLGMTGKQLNEFFVFRAKVGMNEGSTFGPGGEGFMRMNIACNRQTLVRALEQIENAVSDV